MPFPEDVTQSEAFPSEEIKRRLREKAELLAELEAKNPKPKPEALSEGVQFGIEHTVAGLAPTARITADGRKLAGLASRAKKLAGLAEAAREKSRDASAAADVAREALNAYMRETGLA